MRLLTVDVEAAGENEKKQPLLAADVGLSLLWDIDFLHMCGDGL